jgi:hypothetical protein
MDDAKRFGAEFLGTLLLVFFGVGSAIAARTEGGVVVVALTFGFILLALSYMLGPISGCHVNPAVTLGALVSGRISAPTVAALGLHRGTAGRWPARRPGTAVRARTAVAPGRHHPAASRRPVTRTVRRTARAGVA